MIRLIFFVDNLCKTSNSIDKLTHLYKECSERMDIIHFNLRSCNSNSPELRDLMIKDGRYITHNCVLDKVLGYRYNANSDTMHLSEIKLDSCANSKRKILSESSRSYDPICFTAPVQVRPKILVSSLWARKRSKDEGSLGRRGT